MRTNLFVLLMITCIHHLTPVCHQVFINTYLQLGANTALLPIEQKDVKERLSLKCIGGTAYTISVPEGGKRDTFVQMGLALKQLVDPDTWEILSDDKEVRLCSDPISDSSSI
jgi:hypothetical protein